MQCWACSADLIWGGDHDAEDEIFLVITNLHCPKCQAEVLVMHGKKEEDNT
tara:strand:- start:406 stop:558 length:153 start_codon:yes stop_codon:yes gene_type:complete